MWSDENTRDVEPQLEIDDIQADVVVGLQKDFEWFIFFKIEDPSKFKDFARKSLVPRISSAADALEWEVTLQARANDGQTHILPFVGLNLGFTEQGLKKFEVPGEIKDDAFNAGMAQRSELINDPQEKGFRPDDWKIGGPETTPDGVILITGRTQAIVDRVKEELTGPILSNEKRTKKDQTADEDANGWLVIYGERGMTRPNNRGREHFGFSDGISQPGIRGRIDQRFPDRKFLQAERSAGNPARGQGSGLVWPGEFVFGYASAKDATAPDGPGKLALGGEGVPWARNGSLMVLRRLQQDVPEFNRSFEQQANRAGNRFADRLAADPDRLAADAVGRWRSGAPLSLAPWQDDSALGGDPLRNNDFDFSDDPRGLQCPRTSHIRQVYPRSDQAGSTYSHRLIRRGIPFGPEVTAQEKGAGNTAAERGLMFVCYQTSIEDQFEEIARRMNAADPGPFLRFIHLTGGGYFFVPSITTFRNLVVKTTEQARPGGETTIPLIPPIRPLEFDQSNLEHVFRRLRDLFNARNYDGMRPLLDVNITWKRLHGSDSIVGVDQVVQWLKEEKTSLTPQFIPNPEGLKTAALTGDGSMLVSGPARWQGDKSNDKTEDIKYYFTFTREGREGGSWFLINAFALLDK
jgi:Dyp-type peroxidase family